MAIFLDFVGLNTLIHEPISSSDNTIGYEDVAERTKSFSGVLVPSISLHSPSSNSSGQYGLYATNITSYPTTGGFSNSFWIKLDNADTGTKRIWIESSANIAKQFLHLNAGVISFQSVDDQGDFKRWDWAVQMSDFLEWQHIVLSWEGDFSTAPKLYINNEESSLSNTQSNGGSGTERFQISSIYLFSNPNSYTNAHNLKGKLQEFAFYNKQLSSQEISEIYNNGAYYNLQNSTMVGSIFSYWHLGEELTGFVVGDSVPQGTIVDAVIGSVNLEVQENLFIAQGFSTKPTLISKKIKDYENTSFGTIPDGTSLAALNIHRNGPYGYSSFKQLKIGRAHV